jgi:hypothetical protein
MLIYDFLFWEIVEERYQVKTIYKDIFRTTLTSLTYQIGLHSWYLWSYPSLNKQSCLTSSKLSHRGVGGGGEGAHPTLHINPVVDKCRSPFCHTGTPSLFCIVLKCCRTRSRPEYSLTVHLSSSPVFCWGPCCLPF